MSDKEMLRKNIKEKNKLLTKHLNDSSVFLTKITLAPLREIAKELLAKKSTEKIEIESFSYKDKPQVFKRTARDIGLIVEHQRQKGLFEAQIISITSRTEAFIEDVLCDVISCYPKKLAQLGKEGIPLDLFLSIEDREELIRRVVRQKCLDLMYQKPEDYFRKFEEIIGIKIDDDDKKNFFEIKASRDIIVHNRGIINGSYLKKAGEAARGKDKEKLKINKEYFRDTIRAIKKLSDNIVKKIEEKYRACLDSP